MVEVRQYGDAGASGERGDPRHSEEQDGLDIREWLRTLRRHKALIIAITVIGVVLTFLVLNDLTPRYTAVSKVMIKSQDSRVVDFESVMAGIGSDTAAVASQIEILTSESLVGRLVDEANLVEDPEFNPYLDQGETSWAKQLADETKAFISNTLAAIGLIPREKEETLSPEEQAARERAAVIRAFRDDLVVEPVRMTYVIRIAATSVDPKKAADIANTLANLYIVDQLEAKFEATEQANNWLSTRLDDLRQEVVQAESLVNDYRATHGLGNTDDRSLVEQQLNEANSQLTLTRSDLAAAQANYDQVQNLLNNEGVASAAQVLANPLIQDLRSQEAEAKRRLAELSTRYGDRHPDIINAKAEIADIQATIQGEVAKIVQNLANEVAVARARVASIQGTVNQLSERFNVEQSDTVRLRELEREADATRQLYDTMLSRYKEVSEQEDIQEPDARLISEAPIPLDPSWPNKKPIIAVAGIAFLLFGGALAFLLEHLRSGYRNLNDIQQATGIPGLLEMPLLRRSAKSPADQLMKDRTGAYAEAVRRLQTALALSNVDQPPKVICVVSSVPEEGKSTLVSSLGRSSTLGGRKTVIIDCDCRRPQQHRLAKASRNPGLTEVLAGEISLDEALVVDSESGVVILPSGHDVPNPANLLQSQKMRDVLNDLRQRFDLILVDTPAILAISDGLVAASISDATVMMIRWEKTPREVAGSTIQQLRQAGANLIGVVLAQVDQKKQASYGYSAYGYYYGRYKSYYAK